MGGKVICRQTMPRHENVVTGLTIPIRGKFRCRWNLSWLAEMLISKPNSHEFSSPAV